LGKELDEKKGIISDNYQKFPHWECAQEGRITGDKDVWGVVVISCYPMSRVHSKKGRKKRRKKKTTIPHQKCLPLIHLRLSFPHRHHHHHKHLDLIHGFT